MKSSSIADASWPRELLWLAALGVALRLALFWLGGRPELVLDEANYLYAGLHWEYFGHYADSYRYLWPPGYPWLISRLIALFDERAIEALKVLQVLAAGSTGLFTMLIARELFGARAARLAGWIWCFYLPLAGYTQLLWTESLLVACLTPGLYLLLRQFTRPESLRDRQLLLAGLCFAGAAYLKEVGWYLALLLALLMLLQRAPGASRERVRRASLFLLALLVCIVPWTLRNASTYGRLVPLGTTLGENCYNGLNGRYVNIDLAGFDERRSQRGLPPLEVTRGGLLLAGSESESWSRHSRALNSVDRQQELAASGLEWARAHPLDFLSSRLRKLSDLVAPHSFFLRHLALGLFDEAALGAPLTRKLLALLALLAPLCLLPLALSGLGGVPGAARPLVFGVLLFVLATAGLVSMSRFLVPATPLLIALAAGVCERGLRARPLAVALAILLPLWWLSWPGVQAALELAWSAA